MDSENCGNLQAVFFILHMLLDVPGVVKIYK